MHIETECSKAEDAQAFIITALVDILTLSKHVMSDGFKYFYNNRSFAKFR